ncbi:CubicO group peptidase (beta-lactamase class C family) [Microbacteriaceae bacterium MWH-Ta3]|nr:CubicO group peptidase (beta-lactamase class C family) [Microbacteriaceae bacterium MWH-Ta3]
MTNIALSRRHVDSRFEPVAEIFERNLAAQPAGGAAFSLYVDGECMLDVRGGMASPEAAWSDDTLSLIFSCTKGLVAAVVAAIAERSQLDPELPVAEYWPEFAAVSPRLSVRELLEHRAGLAAPREDMSVDVALDRARAASILVAQEPLWNPGEHYAYHALTYGHLAGELLFRVTGQTVPELLHELLAEPAGVEAWIGIPATAQDRVAEFVAPSPLRPNNAPAGSPEYWAERSLTLGAAFPLDHAFEPGQGFNNPRVHQGELAGANGITTAHGIARMWSTVVTSTDGVRTLSDDTIAWMAEPRVSGPSAWGEAGPWHSRGFGVMLASDKMPLLSPTSFGHDGLGGQAGFADLRHRAAFGFTSNCIITGPTEHNRWTELVAATRLILEA